MSLPSSGSPQRLFQVCCVFDVGGEGRCTEEEGLITYFVKATFSEIEIKISPGAFFFINLT